MTIEQKVQRFIEHMNRILAAGMMTRDNYEKGLREITQWANAKREQQMAITIKIETTQEMTDRHVQLGWQCPECYGVRITPRMSHFQAQPEGFQCEECGCQFEAENEEIRK